MKFTELHWFAAFGIFFVATALAILSANLYIEREAERKAMKAAQAKSQAQ